MFCVLKSISSFPRNSKYCTCAVTLATKSINIKQRKENKMCAAVRRQPVAQGGLFSTPKASFSKETQELLKGWLHEQVLICMLSESTIKY